MNDEKTKAAYDNNAALYSQDWLAQPPPTDMYALLDKHPVKGGTTADIGCGNGRDAHWLRQHSYLVTGFDYSDALLTEARKLFPGIDFRKAQLPSLAEIDEPFDNVVCETVIMHLAKKDIPSALSNLQRIVKNHGRLYLSWRVTENADQRHNDGRLYSAYTADFIKEGLASCRLICFEDVTSASSGKRVCRLVAEKMAPPPL
jgi:ubiquinone/menaquinone biosynthesis C-methylase UbiE